MKKNAHKFPQKPKKANPFPVVVSAQREKHPEPMTLMQHRLRDGSVPPEGIPYRKPEVTQGQASKAAGVMADWDNSDPFAYGRTFLHIKQGYLSAKEIAKEFAPKIHSRRLARIQEVENAKSH